MKSTKSGYPANHTLLKKVFKEILPTDNIVMKLLHSNELKETKAKPKRDNQFPIERAQHIKSKHITLLYKGQNIPPKN